MKQMVSLMIVTVYQQSCEKVMFSVLSVCLSVQGVMYRDPVSPTGPQPWPLDMFKLIQLGPHCTKILPSNLVSMKHWLSTSRRLAFLFEMPSCLKQFYMDQWRVHNNFSGEGCRLIVWPFFLKNRMKMKKILAYRGVFPVLPPKSSNIKWSSSAILPWEHSQYVSSSSSLLSSPSHNESIALGTGKDWSSHYIDFFLRSCSPNWQKNLGEIFTLSPFAIAELPKIGIAVCN